MEEQKKKKKRLSNEAKELIKEEVFNNVYDLKKSIVDELDEMKKIMNELGKEIIKETQTMFVKEIDEDKKRKQQKKYIEENICLFLEHYISLKEYVEEAKKQETSKEWLEEAKDSLLASLMEARIDSYEKDNPFTSTFKNIEKAEVFFNFLTNVFNLYIKNNIRSERKMIVSGRTNFLNRKYRTAILLQKHYMEGVDLDETGLYSEDVYYTGSNEYRSKFLRDKRNLVRNLAPLLFGLNGIDFLKD